MAHSGSLFATWRQDIPASLVVFLVALPLCLGIAMASGAPLFSGLIAGVVGGVVVGALSKSPLSVSGPAAGLTVIVLDAITRLPDFEVFLLAVCLAGLIQLALGLCRAGILGNFVPSYVLAGLLTAIGLILILKQLPYAFGYTGSYEGDSAFWQQDGRNTISTIMDFTAEHLSIGATIISVTSLAFLFWWDTKQPLLKNLLRYLPGPLIVVGFGVAANAVYQHFFPSLALTSEQLVGVPVVSSASDFFAQFRFPDFSAINNSLVWHFAIMLALVASVESILSVEAVDKIDPKRRITPTNRELFAQGAGNVTSGLIGGIPVTSVIVRSTANVSAGAQSKLSAISHGILLLVCVVAIPHFLNQIPLSALAAVLIAVGYKLAKPAIFIEKYQRGPRYFVPFMATVVAIIFTDPLIGIAIGLVGGIIFMLIQSSYDPVDIRHKGDNSYVISCKKDLFFLHKHQLKAALEKVPNHSRLLIDMSRIQFMDKDNIDLLNEFASTAQERNITVILRPAANSGLTSMLTLSHEGVVPATP